MRIVFFGTPDFAVPSLEALVASSHEVVAVVAQPDRPAGRGMKLQKPAVAALALDRGIPLLQPARIRNEEFLGEIRRFAPDIGVVVAYGKILPQALLDIPPHGFVNVHASLLPHYRGAAPIQRAIAAGDRVTGVTIMRVDAELDHGPVYAIEQTPIAPGEHTPSLAARLSGIGGALLVDVIDAIERGEAEALEQDHASATFAPKIEKEEGRIRWSETADAIYDRFRAFDPWPGVFVRVGDDDVRLAAIRPEPLAAGTTPGRVVSIDPQGVVVATPHDAIRIEQLQRPGKRPAAAADVARSLGITIGSQFGE